MANQSMPFHFLDLPPELRMRIYPYLLEEDDYIVIHHNTLIRRNTSMMPKARGIGNVVAPPNMTLALLATCKIINKEATPVLYGNNTFNFCVAERMKPSDDHFLEKIGGSIRYLRPVILGYASKGERQARLVLLKKAVFLTELVLSWYLLSSGGTEGVVEELGPLIRSLHEFQRRTKRGRSAK